MNSEQNNLSDRLLNAVTTIPEIVNEDDNLDELDATLSLCDQVQVPSPVLLPPLFPIAYRYGDQTERLKLYGQIIKMETKPAPKRIRLLIVLNNDADSVFIVCTSGILANIDRTKFEIVIMHTSNIFRYWSTIAFDLADIVCNELSIRSIQSIAPDIILYPELGLSIEAFNLASIRLAPVQVALWGHPITSGAKEIDIFFSGELLEPVNAEQHYTERLVKLPGTGSFIVDPTLVTEESVRLGFPPGIVRFLIAQAGWKIHYLDDELYVRIAKEVGVCEFWIVRNDEVRTRLTAAFSDAGLDPDRYLFWFDPLDAREYNGLMDELDIYLDCPSFSGYTTAFRATQRGMPIVTLEGEFMRQRMAAGLLRQIGITETIASSRDEYVNLAVALAKDAELRARIRSDTLKNKGLAFGSVDVVRAFENECIFEYNKKRKPSGEGE